MLKLVAGLLTGSIAILTEAIHSAIDLIASLIALVSVRKADEPADEDHPYGHEKAENVAAGAEAMLILLGAAIIVYRGDPPPHQRLRGRPGRDRHRASSIFSMVANLLVSAIPLPPGDARSIRRRSRATPPTCGPTRSPRSAVLVGLVLVEITGERGVRLDRRAGRRRAIVATGVRLAMRSGRVLMDEAPPAAELDRIERAIAAARPPEMAGYHKLRARRAGSRRHVDLHVQFRSGTTLEDAHRLAHDLRDAIEAEFRNADVLIHVEPEGSYRRGEEEVGPFRHG